MSIDVLAFLVAWYSLGAIATMWVGAAAHIRNGDRLQDMTEEACRVELPPIYVNRQEVEEFLRDPAFLPNQLVEIEGIPANQMGIYKGRKVLLKSENDG